MKKNILLIILSLIIFQDFKAQNIFPAIIPNPVSIEISKDKFEFSKQTRIYSANPKLVSEIQTFNSIFSKHYGFKLIVENKIPKNEFIELIYSDKLAKEAYQLSMTSKKITISGDEAGIFYGLQSFMQMLPPKIEDKIQINCVNINDYPRFSWRGMHLDVSRHFFSKEFIFKYLDYMSEYKLNTFHWHLTDDQGWRIEIKRYPLLTQLGAWRKGTLIGHASDAEIISDTTAYGGFYSQNDIREIVAYAKKLHITIVPEIEMPGHVMATIRAYPFLSCNGGQTEVATTWGVFNQIFCTKDTVFDFIQNVLLEVIELFPGTYIHVGGDECPKNNWKKCSVCQARMKSEGLKDEEELQSYFIRRIEKFLTKHNRKLIGWDEILEGGLAPNAAVMSWRGFEGGKKAAQEGHYVVMTPGSHCYFDHYQGDPTNEPLAIGGYTTIEKVYSFEPMPDSLSDSQQKFILGAQANLWTEYISNEKQVEYMIFPRLCALAEVDWTPINRKNYEDFRQRLLKHFDFFDTRGINYAKSIFEIKKTIICDTINRNINLQLSQAFPMGEIMYYVVNNFTYKSEIKKYTSPIPIIENCEIFAEVRDKNGDIRGKAEQKFVISKTSGATINLTYPPSSYYNYGGAYTLLDGVSGRIPWNGKEWLGFSNTPLEAVVDFGKIQKIKSVSVHTLIAEASWIYLPKKLKVEVSIDGKNFIPYGELNSDDINKIGRLLKIEKAITKARYVKILVERAGIISSGKPGEGQNAWLFVSEIEIN